MFRKILIIEDIDSISLGLTALLEKNFSAEVHSTKYCDEGYLKIRRAIAEDNPYDLIITDLSFKDDPTRESQINSGEELVGRLQDEQIAPKIIVYSIEDKPYLIRSLFYNNSINGFVVKGRESSIELIEAINSIAKGAIYLSPEFANILKQQPLFEIDKYDIEILKLLSEGSTQEDISAIFKKNQYPSPSTSSIEKKINKLKFVLKAQNSIHLVAIAKDMRLV
jgi:DNA-binding NarL/FixJ family response regulator